ncbi:uncharacterized protein LOC141911572 [Tubulanus polymorphus]|uniref:uncharacterized protein LOC141911572 n=1 Tax=Tubulanus polymorphus TaxID=672921 RepID=UPI003DA58745
MRPRNRKEFLKQHADGQPWDKSTTNSAVIEKLKKHFARFGIPKCIVSNPGPQFIASEFAKFARQWGFIHVMSSPGHHSANGKAEAAVKVMKHMMLKALRDGTDQSLALLEQHNTPRQDTELSPAQMLSGRGTGSLLPSLWRNADGTWDLRAAEKRVKRKATLKRHHEKSACNIRPLGVGQIVCFEHRREKDGF